LARTCWVLCIQSLCPRKRELPVCANMDDILIRLALWILTCIVLPALLALLLKVRIISIINLIVSYVFPGFLVALAIWISPNLRPHEKIILLSPTLLSCLLMVMRAICAEAFGKDAVEWLHEKICCDHVCVVALLLYVVFIVVSIHPTLKYLCAEKPRFLFRFVALLVVWGINSFLGFVLYTRCVGRPGVPTGSRTR